MAYLTVTTQVDIVDPGDGQLSLREAIAQANATSDADTIKFVLALEGQTLVLTGGELRVSQDLTIDGDRNHDGNIVTLDGNSSGRLLNISGTGTDVALTDVALANGQAGPYQNGGTILLGGGNLTLTGAIIRNSTVDEYSDGGAIFASSGGRVTILESIIVDNYSRSQTAGIAISNKTNLLVRSSKIFGNYSYYGSPAISVKSGGSLTLESSIISNNRCYDGDGTIEIFNSSASVSGTSIVNNHAGSYGGGISLAGSTVVISDSTIAKNDLGVLGGNGFGAGIFVGGGSQLILQNTTVTSNESYGTDVSVGGGIFIDSKGQLSISNSIVLGNLTSSEYGTPADPEISGTINFSNGHNIFGSAVAGSIAGDRQNMAATTVFAAVDPATGGGKLSPTGIVPLKNATTNPALSAADPITASSFGQLGTTLRPLPTGSLPDIGSIEISQPLSTSPTVNNDVLTGSNAGNNLSGLGGNDLIQGLGGADRLSGNDGSDVLDGGPGNDVLDGGTGLDIATFAGNVAVVVDLSTKPATAKRGSETDTLTSIEGAIGSSKADTFKGDAQINEFQGGLGKDTATGGGGRDLYAFRTVQESPPGAGRDVIKDFAPGQDVIDVSDIDADTTTPGRQSFRWVGKATLTGAAQLGYYVSGGNTIVRASTDADSAAELEIQLTGKKVLMPSDFRP